MAVAAVSDWVYDPNEPRYCLCNQVRKFLCGFTEALAVNKGEFKPKDRILPEYCGFNANISFPFQAIRNLSL